MKVFVLGSNSFSGAHFVEHLLEKTDFQVFGVSRSEELHPVFLPYKYRKAPPAGRYSFHSIHFVSEGEKLLSLLRREKPEYIVNFAAQGEVRNSWKWPEQWFATNCTSLVPWTNAIAQEGFVKKYVAISTPEVYGSTGQNLKESHVYQPSTPYAASKVAGDLFLMTLQKKYGFPVCYTRAANVYGIHQQLFRILPRALIFTKLGRTIELHGEGKSVRSFIHMRDVADATLKVLLGGKPGEVYHIAPDGEQRTIADVVRLICEIRRIPFEKATKLVSENFGQDAMYSLDASKVRNELGWKPKVEFHEGVQEMAQWIDDNWTLIKDLPLDYEHKP